MTTECTAEAVLQYWIRSSVIQIYERLEDIKYEADRSTIGGSEARSIAPKSKTHTRSYARYINSLCTEI